MRIDNLSLETDEDMRWIYDPKHPEYNEAHTQNLRDRRQAAINSAPLYIIEIARLNDLRKRECGL